MTARVHSVVSGLVLAGSLAAQGVKVNGPLAHPTGGDVDRFVVSPDGARVAYIADQEEDELYELFCAPVDGSRPPVKLNDTLAADRVVHPNDLAFSPDGTRVVFATASYSSEHDFHSWSVPADGSLAAVDLGSAIDHLISPDGKLVALRSSALSSGALELLILRIDGSEPPVRLSAPLPPDRFVSSFVFTDDGSTVVYTADQEVAGRHELFAVPADGHAPPRKLNGPLVPGGQVDAHVMPTRSGAGWRVVYRADQEANDRFELFSVPLDGSGPPTKLNGPLVPGGDVATANFSSPFTASPDGTRVLYVADEDVDGAFGLYSVPVDGSTPSVPLTPGLPAGRAIVQFGFASDSTRVYFTCDLRASGLVELFRASVNGSAVARRLSDELVAGGEVIRFELTPDGSRIVYAADQEVDDTVELYRVETAPVRRARIGGSTPGAAVKISDGISLGSPSVFAYATLQVSADGDRVVVGVEPQLYSVSMYPGEPPLLLDDQYTSSLGSRGLKLAGTRVAFLRDDDSEIGGEAHQLYSIPLDGSAPFVRLNDDLAVGPVLGDVFGCDFSPLGDWIVYEADGDIDDEFDLYVASAHGRRPVRKLGAALDPVPYTRRFHPDGERILYDVPGAAGSLPYLERLDGSAPPALVGGPYPDGSAVRVVAMTLDGARVILTGDIDTPGTTELYNSPVQGGAPRFKLSSALLANEDVEAACVSPDGARVLFTVRFGATTRLWCVPIDRAQEPVALDQVADGRLQDYAFTPDGQRVVYRSHDLSHELFSVPSDGSQPATLLSPPLGSGSAIGYVVAPDSTRVVFEELLSTTWILRSVPVSGGTPVTLSPALGPSSSGSAGLVSLDSTAVAFAAWNSTEGRVYRAPIDGSSPAVALSATGGQAFDAHLTSDGAYVVYQGSEVGVGAGILSVPFDGSAAPVRISQELSPAWYKTLEVTPDGSLAVYVTEGVHPGGDALYAVPVTGGRPPRLLDSPLVEGGVVNDIDGPRFRVSSASHAVIYRAAREGVKELYLSLVDGPSLFPIPR